ncbi:MAG: hypothetical protein ACUVTG_10075 [Candidatus Oleimicrobiaceae bacterium]
MAVRGLSSSVGRNAGGSRGIFREWQRSDVAVRAAKSHGLRPSRLRCAIEQDSGAAGRAFLGVGLDLLSYWTMLERSKRFP